MSAGRIGAQIIIMHRDVDSVVNPVPHLIFHVPDVKTVAMAVLHSSQRTDRVQ